MVIRLIITFLIIVTFQYSAQAEIKAFLFQRVEIDNNQNNLAVSDIAKIEGGSPEIQKINNSIVEDIVYEDGFIDKREIFELIKGITNDVVFIYGNAVSIIKNNSGAIDDIDYAAENNSDESNFIVKRGDRINVIVKKNKINIELTGKALSDGRYGDEIKVRVNTFKGKQTRLIKAKILNKEAIEVEI